VTQDEREEARRKLEEMILPFEAARARGSHVDGWLRSMRKQMGADAGELAGKMGVQRKEIFRLELMEKRERIGMGKLRRAADALGCELVYGFVPREGMLSELARRHRAEHKKALRLRLLKKKMAAPRAPGTIGGAEALRRAAAKVLGRLGIRVAGGG